MWQELYPLKHLSGPLFPFFDNWGSDIWKAYRTVERQSLESGWRLGKQPCCSQSTNKTTRYANEPGTAVVT